MDKITNMGLYGIVKKYEGKRISENNILEMLDEMENYIDPIRHIHIYSVKIQTLLFYKNGVSFYIYKVRNKRMK